MQSSKSVGLWIRVSHEDSVNSESPEVHEKRGRLYAEAKGWEVKEMYRLDAKSGKSVMDYPETAKMLSDIKSGKITGLIFSKLARLSRNTTELLSFAEMFRKHDADLISLHESIDTSSGAGRLFFTVIAALAQFEREEIAERVAASVPIRAKMGKPLGGAAPFGYMYDSAKNLAINEEESKVRKLMYDLFLKHKRKLTVANELNRRGYRTRNNSEFSDATIDRLLRDPIAMGSRIRNYTKSTGDKKAWKLKPESEWIINPAPAIISEETFNQCISILNGNKINRVKQPKKTINLFSGLMFCYCDPNHKMYVIPSIKKYTCTKCRNKITIPDIEEVFLYEVKKYWNTTDVSDHFKDNENIVKESEQKRDLLKADIKKINSEIDTLFDLLNSQEIPKEGFNKRYMPIQERLNQKEEELAIIQSDVDFMKIQVINNNEAISKSQNVYENWGTYNDEDKRFIIESITNKIIVNKTEIEITLNNLNASPKFTENGLRNHIVSLTILSLAYPLRPVVLKGIKPEFKRLPVNTLGDHLRKRRKELGLFQKDVAIILKISEDSLTYWENGRAKPQKKHHATIIEFLGYSPGF